MVKNTLMMRENLEKFAANPRSVCKRFINHAKKLVCHAKNI